MKPEGAISGPRVPYMRGIRENLRVDWNGDTLDVGSGIPSRDIDASGFHAKVPLWRAEKYVLHFEMALNGSSCLYFIPVDQYQKTMRSAKYAVMFIALTSMIFYFVGILNKKR